MAVGLSGIVCCCCFFIHLHSPNLQLSRISTTSLMYALPESLPHLLYQLHDGAHTDERTHSFFRNTIARAATGCTHDTGALAADCRLATATSVTTTAIVGLRSALRPFLPTSVRSTRLCRFLGTDGSDGSLFSLSAVPVSPSCTRAARPASTCSTRPNHLHATAARQHSAVRCAS